MRAFLAAAAIAGVVASAATVAFTQAKPPATPSIEGVWQGTSTVVTGPSPSSNPNRQPNLIIYAKKHYSLLTQDGGVRLSRRPVLAPPKDPNNLTDAEKLARYEHWAVVGASSGTYEVKEGRVFQYPVVAKDQTDFTANPVSTGTAGIVGAELKFEGDNTMVQIGTSADGQTITRRTYTRLE